MSYLVRAGRRTRSFFFCFHTVPASYLMPVLSRLYGSAAGLLPEGVFDELSAVAVWASLCAAVALPAVLGLPFLGPLHSRAQQSLAAKLVFELAPSLVAASGPTAAAATSAAAAAAAAAVVASAEWGRRRRLITAAYAASWALFVALLVSLLAAAALPLVPRLLAASVPAFVSAARAVASTSFLLLASCAAVLYVDVYGLLGSVLDGLGGASADEGRGWLRRRGGALYVLALALVAVLGPCAAVVQIMADGAPLSAPLAAAIFVALWSVAGLFAAAAADCGEDEGQAAAAAAAPDEDEEGEGEVGAQHVATQPSRNEGSGGSSNAGGRALGGVPALPATELQARANRRADRAVLRSPTGVTIEMHAIELESAAAARLARGHDETLRVCESACDVTAATASEASLLARQAQHAYRLCCVELNGAREAGSAATKQAREEVAGLLSDIDRLSISGADVGLRASLTESLTAAQQKMSEAAKPVATAAAAEMAASRALAHATSVFDRAREKEAAACSTRDGAASLCYASRRAAAELVARCAELKVALAVATAEAAEAAAI